MEVNEHVVRAMFAGQSCTVDGQRSLFMFCLCERVLACLGILFVEHVAFLYSFLSKIYILYCGNILRVPWNT